jgi:hypothetical protein
LHHLPADLVKQIGPVDVVYLWVNGSDPILQQELQDYAANHTGAAATAQTSSGGGGGGWSGHVGEAQDDPLTMARFDAGRDELRYSLRSLEMYMPWFRHVYIVTNGQVGTWCRGWKGCTPLFGQRGRARNSHDRIV